MTDDLHKAYRRVGGLYSADVRLRWTPQPVRLQTPQPHLPADQATLLAAAKGTADAAGTAGTAAESDL